MKKRSLLYLLILCVVLCSCKKKETSLIDDLTHSEEVTELSSEKATEEITEDTTETILDNLSPTSEIDGVYCLIGRYDKSGVNTNDKSDEEGLAIIRNGQFYYKDAAYPIEIKADNLFYFGGAMDMEGAFDQYDEHSPVFHLDQYTQEYVYSYAQSIYVADIRPCWVCGETKVCGGYAKILEDDGEYYWRDSIKKDEALCWVCTDCVDTFKRKTLPWNYPGCKSTLLTQMDYDEIPDIVNPQYEKERTIYDDPISEDYENVICSRCGEQKYCILYQRYIHYSDHESDSVRPKNIYCYEDNHVIHNEISELLFLCDACIRHYIAVGDNMAKQSYAVDKYLYSQSYCYNCGSTDASIPMYYYMYCHPEVYGNHTHYNWRLDPLCENCVSELERNGYSLIKTKDYIETFRAGNSIDLGN